MRRFLDLCRLLLVHGFDSINRRNLIISLLKHWPIDHWDSHWNSRRRRGGVKPGSPWTRQALRPVPGSRGSGAQPLILFKLESPATPIHPAPVQILDPWILDHAVELSMVPWILLWTHPWLHPWFVTVIASSYRDKPRAKSNTCLLCKF